MARIGNALNFGFGYNITAASPIDSRMLVEFISDLTDETQWMKHPDSPCPPFTGMIVAVKETSEIYVLKKVIDSIGNEIDPWVSHTDIKNWERIGEGTVWENVLDEDIKESGYSESFSETLGLFFNGEQNVGEDSWKILGETENKAASISGIGKYYLISPEIKVAEKRISFDYELSENTAIQKILICNDFGKTAEYPIWREVFSDFSGNSIETVELELNAEEPIRLAFYFENNSGLDVIWRIKNFALKDKEEELA